MSYWRNIRLCFGGYQSDPEIEKEGEKMIFYSYKMRFETGVHLGDGFLDSSEICFCADRLFSALYVEAIRRVSGCEQKLLDDATRGEILFSDSMPFIGDEYYVPKPLCEVSKKTDEIKDRKKWKKKYMKGL